MSLLRLAGYKLYTSQEARTLRTMLGGEGTRDLAMNILLTSKKRFEEDDRRALHRELHLVKESLQPIWGYQTQQYMYASNGAFVPVSNGGQYQRQMYHRSAQTDEDKALLEEIRKVEWRHSKKTYRTEDWQKNNRKKEYRRSAKNHYS